MTWNTRKLLPIEEDHNPSVLTLSHYSPTHSPSQNYGRENNPTNYYNSFKLNPPFDSAMALTVLVLLTALFFMGFFSIYIRRFADESSVDPTRRRRSSGNSEGGGSNGNATTSYLSRSRDSGKGVDPNVVKSLPVYGFVRGDAKQGMMIIDEVECAICLSEFEEKEWMKRIPYCGHVFHVECIDTWLESHVTCPLCRTAKLLLEEEVKEVAVSVEVVVDVAEGEGGGEIGGGSGNGSEVRLVVEGGDTWNEEVREVGPTPTTGERRSTSCVWFGERVRLHRSLSF